MSDTERREDLYPSVEYAYEIGLRSYDWCIQRSDSIDATIDRLLAWFSSITLGIVTIIATKSPRDPFSNGWFYTTIVLFILIILGGVYSKVRGSLKIVSPKELYQKNLHRSEWEFKRVILFWSGRDFELNQGLVNRKGRISIYMIILFIIEGITIWKWITSVQV